MICQVLLYILDKNFIEGPPPANVTVGDLEPATFWVPTEAKGQIPSYVTASAHWKMGYSKQLLVLHLTEGFSKGVWWRTLLLTMTLWPLSGPQTMGAASIPGGGKFGPVPPTSETLTVTFGTALLMVTDSGGAGPATCDSSCCLLPSLCVSNEEAARVVWRGGSGGVAGIPNTQRRDSLQARILTEFWYTGTGS